MRLKLVFILLTTAILLAACGGHKKVVSSKREVSTSSSNPNISKEKKVPSRQVSKPEPPETPAPATPTFKNNIERYVYNYAGIAKEEMTLYGIPASITLAQGILESSAGNGELTIKSNNHFGIKCNGWEGAKVYHDDDAYQECFRKYNDPKYSFRDHSLFLSERRRYAKLFELDKDDYQAWAYGLKKAGYATDPKYPQKLIGVIERYELYKFDDEVLGNKSRKGKTPRDVRTDYTSIRYTVRKGDTLYSISERYDLSVEELKKLNNLTGNTISIGQKLYVKSL